MQALIDNLIERRLDPKACRLFIVDGAKAPSNVIRRTVGAHTIESQANAGSMSHGDACFASFNKIWGIPGRV